MGGNVVLTSGYVSMDHMIKILTPARVGFTSLISNSTCQRTYLGGCSVNIAFALCRLGVRAVPVIRVGSDYEEVGFDRLMAEGDVPLDGTTVVDGEATSASFLIQDNEGQHICCYYPGAMAPRYHAPLDDSLFDGVRLGVITVASHVDNEDFFEGCRRHGVPIAFGMKADQDAFPRDFLRDLLLHSQLVFTNECERDLIERTFGLSSITDLLSVGEAKLVVTTYGERGSAYARLAPDGSVESRHVGICPCADVVDTTGGGDAYMSGFIYGYLSGMNPADCCSMGSTLSSFVLEREGCCTGAPTLEQLTKRFEMFRECGQKGDL